MLYINSDIVESIGYSWKDTINEIEKTVYCIEKLDFAQPIKPYLRYGNLENRIIAMPAYVGGEINTAGIKWIASFPNNNDIGLARAHSVVILNNANTGVPISILNTPLVSIIRTASVSGLMIHYFDKSRNLNKINIGIIGWGPIGQYHYRMIMDLLGDKISKVYIYDIKDIKIEDYVTEAEIEKVIMVKNWKDAYKNSDIFVTCTVSKERYIDCKPKDGALLLNTSLRDFKPDIFKFVQNSIIVDNWEEVCRENTDIEVMSQFCGLEESMTNSITDVVCRNYLSKFNNEPIMFNPMGMGIFDIAIGHYFYLRAKRLGFGVEL